MSEVRDLFEGVEPVTKQGVARPEARATSAASPARLVIMMAAIVLAATVAAYLSSAAEPPVYGGRVELLFNTESYDSEAEFTRAVATQREIMRSEPVVRPAAASAGMTTTQLQKALKVESVGESEVLRITVADRSRKRAGAAAQAVASNFLRRIAEAPAEEEDVTTNLLQDRIEELTTTLTNNTNRQRELELARGGAGLPGVEEARLAAESADLVRRIGALRERALDMEVRRVTTTDVRILAPARVLKDPISPKPKQTAVGGFLLGSLLAAGTAYLLRYLRARRIEQLDRRGVV